MGSIWITYGYEGGEFFSRTHTNESSAKSFVRNFYRYKLPNTRDFVSVTVANVTAELNADDAKEWAK